MNLDQVLTNYDESKVKELQNTLESQLEQRGHHQQQQQQQHQQPHTNFTSGNNNNSYYNTHSSSDNGIFTYNSSNASQSRSNYHSSPYLLQHQHQQQQQQHHPLHHHQDHRHYAPRLDPPYHHHHPYQNGGYLGSGAAGGVMHHQFSSHNHHHHQQNYMSSEQNNNTKTYNNHMNTNTNLNTSNNNNNNNISGGDSVNRSIYHQNNNNNNFNNNNNHHDNNKNNNNNNTASSKNHLNNMPTNEPVKLVYPVSGTVTPTNSNATTIVTGGQAGHQTHHLPNGTISLSQMTGQQGGGGGATIISSPAGLVKTGGHGQGQPQTLIIKNPQGMTMTSNAPGMVTMTKTMNNQGQTNLVGTPTMLQTGNFQIVNVPRATAPQTQNHQTQQKTIAAVQPRVVIGSPQIAVGARPANSTITLSTLQGLQGGQPGQTILVKADNGQYQLLRIGPPAGAQQVAPGTLTTSSGNQTIRLQTVPAQQAPTGQTIIVSSSGPVVTSSVLSNAVQSGQASQALQQQTNNLTVSQHQQQQQQQVNATTTAPNRTSQDNSKEKCRKFLTNLIELSKREPATVERNVRTLIQELVDAHVEPEEFCERLERLLNASPQPCLIGFLKKSLPLLRQSLVTKEIVIEGIKAPTPQVAYSSGGIPAQIRPVAQVGNIGQTQIRMITQPGGAPTVAASTIPRIGQTTIRQTTPIRIQGASAPTHALATHAGPRLITTQLRPGTATLVQNATQAPPGSLTVGSTTIQSTPPALHPVSGAAISQEPKERKASTSAAASYSSMYGDDDINDVAAMGGVNLAEESQRILGQTEFVGTQIRSCKDEVFLNLPALQQKIRSIVAKHGLDESSNEVSVLISHATQERLKNIVEKLAVIAEHRIDIIKVDPRYEVTKDVRGQIKFLEDLDKAEQKRHEEQEREMLMRAAKSRSKTEDPEQVKLKQKAKEMQRAEMEELRQRDANLTALNAIGPRKKPRLDGDTSSTSSPGISGTGSFSKTSTTTPLRPRIKRVNLRDMLFYLEHEKDSCRSTMLYKAYLK